jgi:transposase-like protein
MPLGKRESVSRIEAMPTTKRFKCVKCEADFTVPTFTPEEQMEARRRRPQQNFGPIECPNCSSTAVVELEVLRGR